MYDAAVDPHSLILQCVIFQIFKKRIDDHRSQVKDKQSAGDPKKRLPGQLVVDLFGLDRFIKEKAAEKYDKKRTQQR